MGLKNQKKAMYFTLDALFATLILVGGLLFISTTIVHKDPEVQIHHLTRDLLVAMDTIPVSALNDPFVIEQINTGAISNPDNTILEQIAAYWAQDELIHAEKLANITLVQLVPPTYGLRLTMSPDQLFSIDKEVLSSVIASRRMISGIEKGQAISGSSSVGYLRSIQDKSYSSYAYLGGFVGQGNITVKLEEIPDDVDPTRISSIILEADLERDASVYINNVWCADISASPGYMSANRWDLSLCNTSIHSGINNLSVRFDSLNDAYIGGGYFRVDYQTDTFRSNRSYDIIRYELPEIIGIVNLYESFAVQGTLNSLHVHLYYLANNSVTNNTFYLTIGNTTVYTDDNSTDIVSVTLDNTLLSSILNYSELSSQTIPYRLGFENLSYAQTFIGNADVILITDLSGSMAWNFTHENSIGIRRNCDDTQINESSSERLAVAKCLGKDFSTGILNVTGNQIGLVGYSTSTISTIDLTTDQTIIDDEIGTSNPLTGYQAAGWTCICCGVNSAYDLLVTDLERTVIVPSLSTWRYENNYLDATIPLDSNSRAWYAPDYDDSTWASGPAILGHDLTGTIPISTEMGAGTGGLRLYADLWDMAADSGTPEVDFTSGINSSANTYGIGGAHDGWDWSGGVFDYSASFSTFDWHNGQLRMITPGGTWWSAPSSSGAYAVSITITPELYDLIENNNGRARISFNYEWEPMNTNFANSDQVWIKARWSSPYTGEHYLGTHLDGEHTNGDVWPEIDARNNPNAAILEGFFSQDITAIIEGPGTYYLETGGKLRRGGWTAANKRGTFYLDNYLLFVTNQTDHYYLRQEFTITNLTQVRRGIINLLSDDHASVYLNGNLLFDDYQTREASYWSKGGIHVPGEYFSLGTNVLAVELRNTVNDAAFDLELVGINDSRRSAMLMMTDGEANRKCPDRQGITGDLDADGTADSASDHAVMAVCQASWDYGIITHVVGVTEDPNDDFLSASAQCGNGMYKKSNNITELQLFYQNVVFNILELARQSQSIVVSGDSHAISDLYAGSYILVNQTRTITPPAQSEIELVFQTPHFSSCNSEVSIPSGLRVASAKITSYSGEHWTSLVKLNDHTVFNLSDYSLIYSHLGDPFIVNLPANMLTPGVHNITILTGDDATNTTGCSTNNSLIYSGFVNSSTSRSGVVALANGCTWTVEFDDGETATIPIPSDYTGTNTCSYTSTSINYNYLDAYDLAVYELLSSLDFNNDGRVFINLVAEDLEIIVTLVSDVPYLWGPAIMEVELWQ